MRIKDKFVKQKQFTDRPQINPRNTDSTPLLSRLQKQYLFNQQNPQKTTRQLYIRAGDKQNMAYMVNSVPTQNQYLSHNVIKIDNYEGKRFKTQQGYEPMMTKSRYMNDKEEAADSAVQNAAVYKSSQNIVLRRDKPKRIEQKIYESVDLTDTDRPLTFGLVRKTQPMKSSLQYKQDVKMKNQILDQISSLRKSQETLNGSKDFSGMGLQNQPRCSNHHNKKAKYRLVSDGQSRQEDEMIYCSKCAINLLQQGFKVQEIKQGLPVNKKMTKSQHHIIQSHHMANSVGAPSRIQQMRNFQIKLSQVQSKIGQCLQQSSIKTGQIQEIQRQIWQTESVYDQMIQHLTKMKQAQTHQLNEKKKKKITNLQKYQKQMTQQLQNIKQMKKQMKQFRNKFVIMKQSQFQFLISSFMNKIYHYGNQYKEGQVLGRKIQDQIDQIIIDLCQFCKNIKEVDQSRCSSHLHRNSHHTSMNTNNNMIMSKSNNMNMMNPNLNFNNGNENQGKQYHYQDDFICKQIRGPFRTLFPQQDTTQNDRQQDSPSFNKQPPKMMQKSIRNNDYVKTQYY